MPDQQRDNLDGIAVVGMDGRFPGARNVRQFWQNLCDAKESITFFTDEELLAAGVSQADLARDDYVKAGSVLADIDRFDASFFGYSPREAKAMDPQHRILLECAWGALEDAGYHSDTCGGRIGVYTGASHSTYMHNNLLANPEFLELAGDLQIEIGNDKDFVPTRVSYKMNLKGPSICINTACSTSLVAVHVACQALLDQECDLALSGGVTIQIPAVRGYFYQEDSIVSPDGHCRSFSDQAQGTIFGSGVGIVALKRLEDAVEDRDHIYAVIKGSAINNDGALKVGYTAPSVDGQSEVIAEAQAIADFEPESISYVEAHATATGMGDPIEVEALSKVFRQQTDKKAYCAIGSVKSNLGHLNRAAGVIGLIKTVLALKHKQIPPSLHFERPNPLIDFDNSPFYVNTQLRPWVSEDYPRRAGVSSFGIGGTNAHAVLEESPVDYLGSPQTRDHQLLLISGKSESALNAACDNLRAHLEENRDTALADVAYTLQVGRAMFDYRRSVVCADAAQAIEALQASAATRPDGGKPKDQAPPVVFMFTGQGAQYADMGRGLYDSEDIYRNTVDRCCEILTPLIGVDLRQYLFPAPNDEQAANEALKQTQYTQPALFIVEYAMSQQLIGWGIQPESMIGHSIGEYTAACIAGVFSLEDALKLVADRGRLMQSLPAGSMLTVYLSEHDVQRWLKPGVEVATINAPGMSVISGESSLIEEIEQGLNTAGVDCGKLHTSHAFHSPMMEPILGAYTERVASVTLSTPQMPFVSNVSGTWITPEQATDPAYWANHLRQAVRFADGIGALASEDERVYVEVGPGRMLASLAQKQIDATRVFAAIRHPKMQSPDLAFLLKTVGDLWELGVTIDAGAFFQGQQRQRVSLPTYPFQRRSYWIEPSTSAASLLTHTDDYVNQLSATGRFTTEELSLFPRFVQALAEASKSAETHSTTASSFDEEAWLYEVGWQKRAPSARGVIDRTDRNESWLIFADQTGVARQLADTLKSHGLGATLVYAGDAFRRADGETWHIRATEREDFDRLFAQLSDQSQTSISKVVYLWGADLAADELQMQQTTSADTVSAIRHLGCTSIVYLVQALTKVNWSAGRPARLWLLTHGAIATGEENQPLSVAQTLIPGLSNVVALEHPELWGGLIDIDASPSSTQSVQIVDYILQDLEEDRLAIRGDDLYVARMRKRAAPTHQRVKIRADATYLITGGLGSLGLQFARWFVEQGAKHLVLVGRRGATEEAVGVVDELKRRGAQVVEAKVDVSDAAQLATVFKSIEETTHGLAGIVHAAGVLDDGVIDQLTDERIAKVFAPKVVGTWNLHALSASAPLEFFVCFSSAASIMGAMGQSNYAAANSFMDGLMHLRRSMNLAGLSVNWGPWADVGMAATMSPRDIERLEKSGISSLGVERGTEMFGDLIQEDVAQIGVFNIDWAKYSAENRLSRPLSVLKDLTEEHADLPGTLVTAKDVFAAADADRLKVLTRYLKHEVSRTLSIDAGELDLAESLKNYGLDSMMAIQLRNKLKSDFNVDITMVEFMEDINVANLVTKVADKLTSGVADIGTGVDGHNVEKFPERDKHTSQTTQSQAATHLTAEDVDQLSNQEIEDALQAMLAEKKSRK